MAEQVLDLADAAGVQDALGRGGERLVVPAVGHQEHGAGALGAVGEVPGLVGPQGHRLLAEHVQAAVQGFDGQRVVQVVRGGDDHGVQVGGEQLVGVLGGQVEAEPVADVRQVVAATADADQVDVLACREQREVVAGGPPAGADRAEPYRG